MITEEYAAGLALGQQVKELIEYAGNPAADNEGIANALRDFLMANGDLFGRVVMLGLNEYLADVTDSEVEDEDS